MFISAVRTTLNDSKLFWGNICTILTYTYSLTLEGEGLMTFAAAHHQGGVRCFDFTLREL